MDVDWDQIDHFEQYEFECRCCGLALMDFDFVLMLDKLREEHGRAISISSGYRCPAYNNEISSTGFTGPHTTGKASDLRVSGKAAHSIIKLGVMSGATGVGVSQKGAHRKRFIHLDTLPEGTNRPWVWSY